MSVFDVLASASWARAIAASTFWVPAFPRVALRAEANAFAVAVARWALGPLAVIVMNPVSVSAEA